MGQESMPLNLHAKSNFQNNKYSYWNLKEKKTSYEKVTALRQCRIDDCQAGRRSYIQWEQQSFPELIKDTEFIQEVGDPEQEK